MTKLYLLLLTAIISSSQITNVLQITNTSQIADNSQAVSALQTDNAYIEKQIELKVGDIPGEIMLDPEHGNPKDKASYTDNYQIGAIGQCTWYARGRFLEVTGVTLPGMGHAKDWLERAKNSDEVEIIYDLNNIPERAIAVYVPINDNEDAYGHVIFVEKVNKDERGNITNVLYTDTNGAGDLKYDEFNYGYDGIVKSRTYEEFKNPYGLKLAGFIVAKQ